MKFNIDDYKGKYAMHCKTEEEAKDFCNYMHSVGGSNWAAFSTYTGYHIHRSHTTYNLSLGLYGHIDSFIRTGYTILEWEDFMNKEFTKADLKTGDVVQLRDGELGIVLTDFEVIVCQNGGWIDFRHIREDLTDSFYGGKSDIIIVRRPRQNYDCAFDAIRHDRGIIVYERKEPEEMTLAQVCKLLGKEIKIVK